MKSINLILIKYENPLNYLLYGVYCLGTKFDGMIFKD